MSLEEFTRECQTLGAELTNDLEVGLKACAEIEVHGRIEENFRRSTQATGQMWPPRKDPRPQHPLLILSGDLKAAATRGVRVVDKYTVEVGVICTIPYAVAQQFGTQQILPRPYVNVNSEDADAIAQRIADHVIRAIA